MWNLHVQYRIGSKVTGIQNRSSFTIYRKLSHNALFCDVIGSFKFHFQTGKFDQKVKIHLMFEFLDFIAISKMSKVDLLNFTIIFEILKMPDIVY